MVTSYHGYQSAVEEGVYAVEPKVVMASKFKEHCLALLDQVESTKITVVVTKHGRPVAQLVPLDDDRRGTPTMGSVRLIAEDDADYFSTGARWSVDEPDDP